MFGGEARAEPLKVVLDPKGTKEGRRDVKRCPRRSSPCSPWTKPASGTRINGSAFCLGLRVAPGLLRERLTTRRRGARRWATRNIHSGPPLCAPPLLFFTITPRNERTRAAGTKSFFRPCFAGGPILGLYLFKRRFQTIGGKLAFGAHCLCFDRRG